MITSDKQYTAARKQLDMLIDSLLLPKKKNIPSEISRAADNQLRELIEEIQTNIDEYDELKKISPSDINIRSLDELMTAPIRYRIAAHMSVDAFGRKVGVNARQIIRYESENYQNTNSSTLRNILLKLNIRINGSVL